MTFKTIHTLYGLTAMTQAATEIANLAQQKSQN